MADEQREIQANAKELAKMGTAHLKLSNDPNITLMSGRKIYVDTDALFAAGKGWTELEQVRRDPRWLTALGQRKSRSSSAPIEVEAFSDEQADIEAKELVEEAFSGINLRMLRRQLLDGLGDGFSVAEIVWAVKQAGDRRLKAEGSRGPLLLPVDAIVKPAEWFQWGEDGTLYFSPDGVRLVDLPARKFLTFRNEATANKPHGVKLLAVCYWYVYIKKHALKFRAIYLEKFSVPPIVASYAAETTPADIEKLETVLAAWSTDMGIKIPDTVKIQIVEGIRQGKDPFDAVIYACDSTISQVLTGGTLTIEASSQDGKGTQALGTVHENSLDVLAGDDAAQEEELLTRLAAWVCELNLGPGRNPPIVRIRLKDEKFDTVRNQELRAWITLGLPVPLWHAYEVGMIPAPAEGEELVEATAAAGAPMFSAASADSLSRLRERAGVRAETEDPHPSQGADLSRKQERFSADVGSDSISPRDRWLTLVVRQGQDHLARMAAEYERLIDAADNQPETPVDDDPARLAAALAAIDARENELSDKGLKPLALTLFEPILQARLFARLAGEEEIAGQIREQGEKPAFAADTSADSLSRLRERAGVRAEIETPHPAAYGMRPLQSRERFSADESSPFDKWKVDPAEAIEAMRKRRAVSPERWKEMEGQEKAKAFGMALAPDLRVVRAAKKSIQAAIEDGTSYGAWREEMRGEYKSLGLTAPEPWYSETIFATNVLSAYGRGSYEQIMDPDVAGYLPYVLLTTAGDGSVRPEHAALAGVYRRTDPLLRTHWPPLGFKCRCGMEAVTAGRLEELGLPVRDMAEVLRGLTSSQRARIEEARAAGFGNTEAW